MGDPLVNLRLDQSVRAACPAIQGVTISGGVASVSYRPDATPAQRAAAQAALDGFDWSQDAQIEWQARQDRAAAIGLLMSAEPIPTAVEAVTLVVMRILQGNVDQVRAHLGLRPFAVAAADVRQAIGAAILGDEQALAAAIAAAVAGATPA